MTADSENNDNDTEFDKWLMFRTSRTQMNKIIFELTIESGLKWRWADFNSRNIGANAMESSYTESNFLRHQFIHK